MHNQIKEQTRDRQKEEYCNKDNKSQAVRLGEAHWVKELTLSKRILVQVFRKHRTKANHGRRPETPELGNKEGRPQGLTSQQA